MAWQHRLSDIDPAARTATCALCGPVAVVWHSTRWRCKIAKQQARGTKENLKRSRHEWRYHRATKIHLLHRGDTCDRCGYVPTDVRALDVHHIDEDHSNNDPANLRTLCPTCHRETHLGIPMGDRMRVGRAVPRLPSPA